MKRPIELLLAGVVALWCTSPAYPQPLPEGNSGIPAKQAVFAKKFIVATANPLATEAGYRILRQGGSAVDAAIAAQLVLNLVEPQSSGIGGGAFILHYAAKERKLSAYDGRETAPAAARPDRFLAGDGKPMKFYDAVVGGKSVGVPGTLRVLELAYRKHGRLPWATLFEPAIRLAEHGFKVSPRLNTLLSKDRYLPQQPGARDYFYDADGSARAVGHVLKNPQFGAVLRRVAREGVAAFYEGEIAQDIVDTVRNAANPGDITVEDLAGYRAKERKPVCGPYRAYRICGMPSPSSGGMTVLQMLTMLERFEMDKIDPGSAMAAHLFAEAGKLAYADRGRYMGDSDFVAVPERALIDRDYLTRRSRLISPDKAMTKGVAGEPDGMKLSGLGEDAALDLPSTSHLVAVDRRGNAVSMTTTIEAEFGSRLMVRGFLLNNELTDFSFAPAQDGKPVANRVEAGKRPRSSMAPTIVFDREGKVHLLIGSPGGSAIINYVAKTLIGVLDWGLDVQQAIALPNMGSRNIGGATELEEASNAAALAEALQAMGHKVKVIDLPSGLHGVQRVSGQRAGWVGGADPRREGIVRGD
jgi:gamma-glutamyltranspeptidase/glutathione hydrolase